MGEFSAVEREKVKHVFIVGSKGIPAAYGGYETFVDELTAMHETEEKICYHVACKNAEKEFQRHGARCFPVKVAKIGKAQAVLYDVRALKQCISYVKEQKINSFTVYVLACRTGWFFKRYARRVRALGGEIFVNPDGHEWKRKKWSFPVRKYWKYSEKQAVKYADLVVCDSKNIEKYIQKEYAAYSPRTIFIPYGAQKYGEPCEKAFKKWAKERDLKAGEYYLVVGRFVPENNIELILREFMKSGTKKKLALITDAGGGFYQALKKRTGFEKDERIVFAGTTYDRDLLREIRKNAFAYIHGHEVGGTNPSLLEALAATDVNVLLDVFFNREVGEDGALYFSKEDGSLCSLIEETETFSLAKRKELGERAKERIETEYSWEKVAKAYKNLFLRRKRQ